MNKKFTIVLFLLTAICIGPVKAQRYLVKTFDSVMVSPNVQYGHNNNYQGLDTVLLMDIYQPYGDTAAKRPLLVFAHGGSFVGGTRKDNDMVYLCNAFAKRGYVCVSIEYRLGVNIFGSNPLQNEFANAVWRGVQDGKAAVRFFTKDLATTNTYRIDEKNIYLGGSSAGGVLGMHMAFLDKPAEVASYPAIDTIATGGIEGNSGNPGYSWKIKGVINLCGAIGNVNWMFDTKNISIFSVHGTNDQTVPYKSDYYRLGGLNIAFLQGSFSIDSAAKANGMSSAFHTFFGQDHVPYDNNTLYMDTTETLLAIHLYNEIEGKNVGTKEAKYSLNEELNIYPVPASNEVHIQSNDKTMKISLSDMSGRTLRTFEDVKGYLTIERGDLRSGIYFVQIEYADSRITKKIIFE